MKSFFNVSGLTVLLIASLLTYSFAQIDWIKDQGNPVLPAGLPGAWDDFITSHSSVIFDGNEYHMWYHGRRDPGRFSIGHATSPDGIVWQKNLLYNPVLSGGPAGSWDDAFVFSPSVVYDDSIFHMWYTGGDGNTQRIGYAWSSDGVVWEKHDDPTTTNPPFAESDPVLTHGTGGSWDNVVVEVPAVIMEGDSFTMWYRGDNNNSLSEGIGRATSSDGINWAKDMHNPVLDPGSPGSWDYPLLRLGSVVFDGIKYHLFYYGGIFYYNFRIGYAWSLDGISWTKYDRPSTPNAPFAESDPVLTWGQTGSWDETLVWAPWVMLDTLTSTFKMWYSGARFASDSTGGIGYATAPLTTIYVPGNFPTIQAAINAASDGNLVLVSDGTYQENINFKGKAITVASHFYIDGDTSHISNTIIDGSQPSHPDSGSVVCFSSGGDTTSVLCGFTITGGSGSYYAAWNVWGGGGIVMYTGGKIIHNKITGNQVHVVTQHEIAGGGLVFTSINNTNLIIEHNEFIQNSLSGPINANGGGIWLGPRWNDGSIRVNNNLISNNSVTCTGTYKAMGGGVGVSLSLPTAGTIIIERNRISDNELHCIASIGGGIYVVYTDPGYVINDQNPSPLIRNNIISNNDSEGLGGGIGVWTIEYGNHYPNSNIKPQPVLINNTIANNVAQDGSGLFNFDSYPLLLNNILWDDLSAFGSNEIFDSNINFSPYVPPYHDPSNDGEVFIRYSDIQDTLWLGEGNMNVDPLFIPGDSLFNLETTTDTSRCLNSGSDSIEVDGIWYYAPASDYAGNPRPQPVGTSPDMGAWEYDVVNALENIQSITHPKSFSLKQNYPNPFNPTTTIVFDLKKTSEVSLKVFNILGEEVATLVSDRLSVGSYSYEWDASSLASGVYLYRLQAGDYVKTRKMVLMK